MFETLHQALVGDMVEMRLEVRKLDVEEPIFIPVCGTVGQNVVHGELALLPGRHKDDNRLRWGVFDDGQICGLRHGDHERREMGNVERLDVDLHRQRSSTLKESVMFPDRLLHQHIPWGEVKDSMCVRTDPLSQLAGVGQRNAARDDSCLVVRLRRHIPGSRYNYFIRGANFAANQLDFVCDQKTDILNMLALLPPTG